jgi:UDP-N-acetylmuramoyl-L-alanyl-D-glutamate--2,6-diaminopimelate ligase
MKTLRDILYKVSLLSVKGSTDLQVQDICMDSRQVKPGSLFIAVRGTVVDGHDYIETALNNGAVAVVCEKLPASTSETITWVQVAESALATGLIAHQFYGEPSQEVQVVGVTGTNGKTTIATLLFKLFSGLGYRCGLLSTVQNQLGDEIIEATHTTPDAITLNRLMRVMAEGGCRYVFMEVSSHALHQHRVAGLRFAGAIFSNITHDHLDYHKTFDEYIRVKKSFFDFLPNTAFALSNADDKRGQVMVQNTAARTFFYSLKTLADFKGKVLENALTGLQLSINNHEVHCRLIGEFNAYNLLAVYGAAICLGEKPEDVLPVLSNLSGAEGRFDYIISPVQQIIGIVDYAHTPDALLNVLTTIKKLRQGQEKIISIVGCGGNRDAAKRPLMAAAACEHSDTAIFTSDNPRFEDPLQIIADMEAGMLSAHKRKYIAIADRREAIKAAVNLANPGDIILVAGKGHEKYQEVKGVKHDFDDKKVLAETFRLLEK